MAVSHSYTHAVIHTLLLLWFKITFLFGVLYVLHFGIYKKLKQNELLRMIMYLVIIQSDNLNHHCSFCYEQGDVYYSKSAANSC